MQLTQAQIKEIDLLVVHINEQITSLKQGISLGSPRLKALHDAGFHIEAIWLNGQLLEHALKQTLRSIELQRQIATITGTEDPYPKLRIKNIDNQPLGSLIEYLKSAIKNSDLIKSLRDFNVRRKEIVHKIFDGKNNIQKHDEVANAYAKSEEFSSMLMQLAALQREIQLKTEDLYS